MKKSIFLFFAAILCAMTANAQLYLRGGFNDWGTGDKFKFVSNVCEIELAGGATYEFKISDDSWGTQFGGNLTFTATATKILTSNGGNMKITTTIPGTYRFEFVQNTKKLTVTYPELPAPHDITIRAQVPASWTNTITAWVWTSENGTGEEVTPTKDGDYYVVTKNAGALYAIFKNGAGWNGDKNQTVDLCYTEDVCLQINQSGTAKATATVIECGAVAKDITVKAVVPGAWEETITAWVWPTGGEGKEVTPTKDGNWYVVTENCIELNVIFKNGTGWNGNENQTANIAGVSKNTCYQISALNKDSEGKCTYTVVDCDATIEPEAKPEDIYTIVGTATLVGTAWDLNNTDNDMTKQTDGSYVLVKEDVELTTTGTYEYKVVKNRSYDWKDINSGNNITLTGVEKDGIYDVTFTLNKELNELSVNLELIEETKIILDCYVSGDESLVGTGKGWNADAVVMTYNEDTEVYTATLSGVPAGTHNMKVVYGGAWLGYDKLSTPAPANVSEGEDNKIQFILEEAGDVTVTYHATNGIGLTGNFAEPVTYEYYLTGTLVGGWSATQQGIEKDGDVYKATFTNLAVGEYEFKITDGQFNSETETTHEHTTLGAVYEEVSGGNGSNIKITLTEAKDDVTVIFDGSKITFDGLTPDETPTKYYIVGSFNEWNTTDPNYELILDGEVYKKEVTFAKDVQFKVCDGTWANSWGKDNLGSKSYNELEGLEGGNLKMKEAKTFTIIFDLANNLITFEDLTEKAPAVITYVLMGVNGDWTTGIPMTQNTDPEKVNEYVLTCQAIAATDAVKVVKCEDGVATAWYGSVKDGVQVTVNYDASGNIQLPAGTYNFYFDSSLDDKQLWIESATDCGTEPTPVEIRTGLTVGQWGTLCPDQKVTDMQGASFYTLTYLEMKGDMPYQLFFDEITTDYLEAGKPYLFIAESEEIKGVKSEDVVSDASNYNGFYGNVSGNTISLTTTQTEYVKDGDVVNYYGVINSRFTLLGNGTTVAHERAYVQIKNGQLDCPNPPASLPALAPGARRVVAGATGTNVATGMENVDASAQPVKTIINGQLYILRGEKMYDAQGKLVK